MGGRFGYALRHALYRRKMGPGTVPQSGNSEWPRLFSIMFVSQDESPGESNSIPGSIQCNPPSRDRKYLPLVVWLPVEAAVLPPIKEFRRSGPMSGSKWRPGTVDAHSLLQKRGPIQDGMPATRRRAMKREMRHNLLHLMFGALLAVGAGIGSGCATIVHLGSNEGLMIKSEPAGAKVVIDGADRGVTPLEVEVERKKSHTVVLSMDGYKETTQKVESGLSWWLAGNAVFGGVIGLVVDVLSGGGYTIEPSAINLKLENAAVATMDVPLGSLTSSTGTLAQ